MGRVTRTWVGAAAILVLVSFLGAFPPSVGAGGEDEDQDTEDGGYVTFSKERTMGVAKSDAALVYVVRPAHAGAAIKSFFLVDDEILGINKSDSYFFAQVAPGKHVFWSKSENVDALELEVEAGKTYYIQQHVQLGAFKARTKLEVLDDATGQEGLAKCDRYATMTAKGRDKGAEIAREHREDTVADLERRAKKAEEKDAQ